MFIGQFYHPLNSILLNSYFFNLSLTMLEFILFSSLSVSALLDQCGFNALLQVFFAIDFLCLLDVCLLCHCCYFAFAHPLSYMVNGDSIRKLP